MCSDANVRAYIDRAPKAPVTIRAIIVGGSIAGLSTAFALRCAGHDVLVLESSDGSRPSRGPVRMPPNGTRLLNAWGMGNNLEEMSTRSTQFTFVDGLTGERLGLIRFHQQLMSDIGADFNLTQHGDLHSLLYKSAVLAGVQALYNQRVVRVDAETRTVFVANGDKYKGDIIVGADGYTSTVRDVVLNERVPTEERKPLIVFNMTVSTEEMRHDPELLDLAELPHDTIWAGEGSVFTGILVHSKTEYGMSLSLWADHTLYEEKWDEEIPVPEIVKACCAFYEPRVRKLLELATSVRPTKFVAHGPFDSVVHESGRVVLVGDAAHPITPAMIQNTSTALEDAAMLGALFTHVQAPKDLPLLLSAYDELRQGRCARIQSHEQRSRDLWALPRGPAQRARNDGMRASVAFEQSDFDDVDEEYLRSTWNENITTFNFDAIEAVEDWWATWSKLIDRERAVTKEQESESDSSGDATPGICVG